MSIKFRKIFFHIASGMSKYFQINWTVGTQLMTTIADKLRKTRLELTRSEQMLAEVVLENYPASGLGPITTLANRASVSTATIVRLVKKLGFDGYPEFQSQLRDELGDQLSGPITKHDRWINAFPGEHILNRYTESVIGNIKQSLGDLDVQSFNLACDYITDPKRSLFVVGGRITRVLADHFFLHMQVVRSHVTLVNSNSNAWPHYLLDIKKGDVLVVFDIRRYETSTLRLVEFAKERGVEVILFTDQWQSPVTAYSSIVFASRIEVPSAWDSIVPCLLLNEAIIANAQEMIWGTTRDRMEELEDMFDRTKFFKKF